MSRGARNAVLPIANTIDLVIFDCDGVLVDSEIISAEVLLDELKALGLSVDVDYILQNFLGHSFASTEYNLRRNLGLSLPPGFKAQYGKRLKRVFEQRLRATPSVDKVLQALNVAVCVASSSGPKRVRHALELVDLAAYFQANVFTSSEVEHGKPAPDLFLHAANRMKVAPERCLVIEDSIAGIAAGLSAGMSVVHYAGGSHLAASNNKLPHKFAMVPVLDDWLKFYDMAPHLRKNDSCVEV